MGIYEKHALLLRLMYNYNFCTALKIPVQKWCLFILLVIICVILYVWTICTRIVSWSHLNYKEQLKRQFWQWQILQYSTNIQYNRTLVQQGIVDLLWLRYWSRSHPNGCVQQKKSIVQYNSKYIWPSNNFQQRRCFF